MTPDPNGFVPRREIDIWQAAHEKEHNGHFQEHHQHAQAHDREHAATQTAITKAETNMERRLEGVDAVVNRFRESAAEYVTRDMAEVRHESIDKEIEAIAATMEQMRRWQASVEGRAIGISLAIGAGVTIINLILAFAPR